jgi:hypothetical protein
MTAKLIRDLHDINVFFVEDLSNISDANIALEPWRTDRAASALAGYRPGEGRRATHQKYNNTGTLRKQ